MQAISTAIGKFHEDASWFARAHELKLLVVRTSGDLRSPLLRLLPGYEFHADNLSPWVILADPRTARDDGWLARANRLAQDWEKRRAAFAEQGTEVAAIEPPPGEPPPAPTRRLFQRRSVDGAIAPLVRIAGAIVQALPPPQRGLVLALAPALVDDAAAFEEELCALLAAPEVAACRFVLVLDVDVPLPKVLLAGCGPRALLCECVVDPRQQERDLAAMLAGEAASPFGAAPPGVVPPKRKDGPPQLSREERDQALAAAGVSGAFADEGAGLGKLVLGAALALKQGRGADAVRLQREARDLAERLQMPQIKVICQIALASYLSGLGLPDRARRELEEAAAHARLHGLATQESQAHLILGLVHTLAHREVEAIQAYTTAAQAAQQAGVPLLAIEAWRLAGQIALQVGAESQAVSCFKHAVVIVEGNPQTLKASGAVEMARCLSVVFRDRGLKQQAASLDEVAARLEQGELPILHHAAVER